MIKSRILLNRPLYSLWLILILLLSSVSARAAVIGEKHLGGFSKLISENPPENQYTEREVYLLSRLIYREVGNSTEESMMACGGVVLNRIKDLDYPDTLVEVLYQIDPVQYSTVWRDEFYATPSQVCKDVAVYLLIVGSQLPQSVVYQSTFPQGSGVYLQIRDEIFSYK